MLSGVRREAIGEGQFDLAANGTLVFAPGVDGTVGRIVRLLPGKQPEPLPLATADFQRFDLSRDGRWLAAVVQGPVENELRQYDLRNGQNFTWLRGEYLRHPLWDPSGEPEIIIGAREGDRYAVLRGAPSSGAQADTILTGTSTTGYFDAHRSLPRRTPRDRAGLDRLDGFRAGSPSVRNPRMDTVVTGARFATLSPNGHLVLYGHARRKPRARGGVPCRPPVGAGRLRRKGANHSGSPQLKCSTGLACRGSWCA